MKMLKDAKELQEKTQQEKNMPQGELCDCAPHEVRMAVIKDMRYHEVDEYLYKEMKRYYENGPSKEN